MNKLDKNRDFISKSFLTTFYQMGKSCCFKFSRIFIGIFNLIVIIAAVVASAIVYGKEQKEDYAKLLKTNLPFVFLFFAMAVACLSAFVGFFSWTCKKRGLYIAYLVLIIVAICVEITGIILAFVYKDQILDGIKENWLNSKVEGTRILIEQSFHCCGFDEEVQKIEKDQCGYKSDNPNTCYGAISDALDKNLKYLQIGIIIMTVLEILLLSFACYLVSETRKARVGD